MPREIAELLAAIATDLTSVRWSPSSALFPASANAVAFEGVSASGRYVVVSFDIEDQGFPPESRGYDGAFVDSKGTLCRFTRELAELAFYLAEEGTRA
jgi:hypothetical protein